MFTGIIETIGKIKMIAPSSSGMRISISASAVADEISIDDSIAVNGICLTVVELLPGGFAVDAVRETVSRSTLADWRPGACVNLERGMPAAGRFDGHIVQGHVDGVAELLTLSKAGNSAELTFKAGPDILNLMVEKGSVALDGVSLTIAKLGREHFTVAIIPYTLENTTFKHARSGMKVNVETDIIGKYIAKFAQNKKSLDKTTLRSWGYE